MHEFETNRKVKVVINAASFKDANTLKNAILNADGKDDYTINIVDLEPKVEVALWPCLLQCTYGGQKITQKTFESEEAREDYYPVLNACVVENLRPFMKGLASTSLLGESLKNTNTPKSA